jgi:ubiquinone/menaquinone biosynthesis C-methylase UbiE
LNREDFYQPGLPALPGQHYRALVRYATRHAGQAVLDLGCGYGAYSIDLSSKGFRCTGCDINLDYLRKASQHGLPVVAANSALPFPDGSFDTVLLFEVIEHVSSPETLLKEAFRVARKNVLVTVPNVEDIERLKSNDVTYAHMLSSDHVNFFDVASLTRLLAQFGQNVVVDRGDPIYPFWFLGKSAAYYSLRAIYRLGLLKPRFFSRIYAVASVRQN